MTQTPSALLSGIGAFAPARVLTNADLERMVDTSDEWITSRTGMKERRIVEPGTGASELAYPAAKKALARAGLAPADLDLVIVATVTADYPLPAAACFLREKLGASKAAAFDIAAACAGWIYGLSIARAYVLSGQVRHVLVVGVEVMSSIADYKDRSTCVLFGDAAGAGVVSASDERDRGILAVEIKTDGSGWESIHIRAGGSVQPTTPETARQGQHFMRMNGREVFKVAVRHMTESCKSVLAQAGLAMDQVDLVVPHQANLRIITAMTERLGIAPEKVFVNIQRYGNTSSASVGLALDEALESGRIGRGSTVLVTALGAGLSWGAALIRL